jgi:hypothetical protein
MSADDRWTPFRWVALAAIGALAWSFAPLRPVSAAVNPAAPARAPRDTVAVAAPDTTVAASPDTTARSRVDTSAAASKRTLGTMDELKRVLGEETGGIREGKAYKERKNGKVAMACAVLIPGLGQMYNEKPVKAAIALGLESYYLSQIVMYRRLREREILSRDVHDPRSLEWKDHNRWVTEYWERSVDWIWWSGAVVLGIVIDAYVDAKLDDMRFKVEPVASEGNVGLSLVVRY